MDGNNQLNDTTVTPAKSKKFTLGVSFRCVLTLLCVLLVSGIFLTIMSGLLEVSAEERFQRAISKIYGKNVTTQAVAVADYNSNATINEAYKVTSDGGNYLVKSTGKGGFDNGTVTCWVVVIVKNGAVGGIQKVTIDSNVGQSYIGNITQSFLNSFAEKPAADLYYYIDDGYVTTGASRSSNAICNAVNGAIDFVNAQLGNVAEDIFADFLYTQNIDTKQTTVDEYDPAVGVSYHVKTASYGNAAAFDIDIVVGNDGRITKYEIVKNGSTGGYDGSMLNAIKDGKLFVGKNIDDILALINGTSTEIPYPSSGDLKTGATQSNFLCANAAAFAAANYSKLIVTEGGETEEEGGAENE